MFAGHHYGDGKYRFTWHVYMPVLGQPSESDRRCVTVKLGQDTLARQLVGEAGLRLACFLVLQAFSDLPLWNKPFKGGVVGRLWAAVNTKANLPFKTGYMYGVCIRKSSCACRQY